MRNHIKGARSRKSRCTLTIQLEGHDRAVDSRAVSTRSSLGTRDKFSGVDIIVWVPLIIIDEQTLSIQC